MRFLFGVILFVAGICFGLWAGIWWALIGGLIQVINQIRAEHMDTTLLVYGIARVLGAGLIGWVCGIVAVIPCLALIGTSK
jgi:hypothetical protein